MRSGLTNGPGRTSSPWTDRLRQEYSKRLEELALDPYSPRLSKAVKMSPGTRSSRVGEWRIFYEVDDDAQAVLVIAIRPRAKAY
jgi:mRNA interferase RelE/StbE